MNETRLTSGVAAVDNLHAAHLRAHHGARTRAGGVDEVSDPDVAVERLAVEGLAGLSGELEGRDLAEDGQGLGPGRQPAAMSKADSSP